MRRDGEQPLGDPNLMTVDGLASVAPTTAVADADPSGRGSRASGELKFGAGDRFPLPKGAMPRHGGPEVAQPQLYDIANTWITKKQLAATLGVSVSFINKCMKLGLPCKHWGRAVRFRLPDVTMWFERNYTR